MTDDRAQTLFFIAFALLLVILLLPPALHTIMECRAAGGTVVRGLASLECIR